MRLLRGLLGSLLWIVAALLGLVSVILCVTVILLPLGIPLLKLSKRLFGMSVRLMLPSAVAHPVRHAGKKADQAKPDVSGMLERFGTLGHRAKSRTPKAVQKTTKKGRKLARKQRKRLASAL